MSQENDATVRDRGHEGGEHRPVLVVRDLAVSFETEVGSLRAVEGVDLDLHAGRTTCLVGESGCGKTVTALALIGLLPESAAVERGTIELVSRERGEVLDLVRIDERARGAVRGREIAMIFQDPSSALHPTMTVGAQLAEGMRVHLGLSRASARARAEELLRAVGIAAPRERLDAYPHQLSGGMRQRVMIAIALACFPRVLVADEPTTALDVTVAAQILELLRRLRDETGLGVLLVTHDFGVVSEAADDVVVMYAGRAVEIGPVEAVLRRPSHPYTRALLQAMPSRALADRRASAGASRRLPTIPGAVPSLGFARSGCAFAPRCERVREACDKVPTLRAAPHGGRVACWDSCENDARDDGNASRA